MVSPLKSAQEVHAMKTRGETVHILDVRWQLGRDDGHEQFRHAHIPGAVYVDVATELADANQPPSAGRHPLPRVENLQASARKWGLHAGDAVVVYDDSANLAAARAWWLLTQAGVDNVTVLDGALTAWVAAGFLTESGESTPEPGSIELSYAGLRAANIEEVATLGASATLLDARAQSRFTGAEEPVDPRAGHIPGARNAPAADNVDETGAFHPAHRLREKFLSAGVDPEKPVVSYCGSGVTGAHTVLALELAGFDAVLYPGSFSQWSSDPQREVETGVADHPRR